MPNSNRPSAQQTATEQLPIGELPRLKRAVELLSRGSFTESKFILEQILQLNPCSTEAHYLLGLAFIELQDHTEAARALRKSLEISPNDPAVMFALATALHKANNHRSATDWYRAALALEPTNFDIASGLAVALSSTGDTHEALAIYDRLLRERPGDPVTHINRGNTYQAIKQHLLAIADYQAALVTLPNDPQVPTYLANSLIEIGDRPGAIIILKTACRENPSNTDMRVRLAQLLINSECQEVGLSEIQSIIDDGPADIEILASIGVLYQKLERWNQALAVYDKAININPTFFVALLNRGTVNAALGRTQQALCDYNDCIHLNPSSGDALFNRGNLRQRLHQIDIAEADFRNGLLVEPNHRGLNQNLAVLLFKQGRFSEAAKVFSRLVDLVEDKYETLLNLAQAYLKAGDIQTSLKYNEVALSTRPEAEYLLGLIIHQRMMICDWHGWNESVHTLEKTLREDKPTAMPFHLLAITEDPTLQIRCATNYTNRQFTNRSVDTSLPELATPTRETTPDRPTTKNKIRLGYFSSDFYRHATTLLISEMISRHTKDAFEIIVYHFATTSDDVTERIKSACDEFYDVSLHSSHEIIQLAKKHQLDIAIDLKGHTENSRTEIFAERVAPVQINYLGYPGTMGGSFIDYIVADEEIIPATNERYYSERVIRLSPCYQPNDSQRPISDRNFTRRELNLPDDAFVYCCFNNSYKITPPIFDAWMRILRAVPKSVLWLLSCNRTADENLRREADVRGVEASRLIFAPAVSNPLHLARLRNADLFLDTFPCGAHTTASDSLWSGVPLLAIKGETFASRVASSLLQATGMTETITRSVAEYEALAIHLGLNIEITTALRQKLAMNKLTSRLFDPGNYIDVWERELRTLAPASDASLDT